MPLPVDLPMPSPHMSILEANLRDVLDRVRVKLDVLNGNSASIRIGSKDTKVALATFRRHLATNSVVTESESEADDDEGDGEPAD